MKVNYGGGDDDDDDDDEFMEPLDDDELTFLVKVYCIKFSASGPKISNFLRGDKSVAIALSLQAVYSFIVPELVKLFANQKPLYSIKFLVSSDVFL